MYASHLPVGESCVLGLSTNKTKLTLPKVLESLGLGVDAFGKQQPSRLRFIRQLGGIIDLVPFNVRPHLLLLGWF